MEATVTKVAKGFSKVLEILGELPVAPEPGKVRSTTQRRGTTTKPVISLGLPIAMRNRGTFATLALRRSAALLPGSAGVPPALVGHRDPGRAGERSALPAAQDGGTKHGESV